MIEVTGMNMESRIVGYVPASIKWKMLAKNNFSDYLLITFQIHFSLNRFFSLASNNSE